MEKKLKESKEFTHNKEACITLAHLEHATVA